MAEVTIIIPSTNARPTLLPLAIESIRAAGGAVEIVLLSPDQGRFTPEILASVNRFMTEPVGVGLAGALHVALSEVKTEFQGWLGDDDLLAPQSLQRAIDFLRANPDAIAVFGGCQYIDSRGTPLVLNRSGQWAVPLLRFGPQLIPQPSVIWRSEAYRRVAGLSSSYKLAFDFDLLLQLSKLGRIGYLPEVQSSFRWHADSLSVKRRWLSATEASRVRRSHYRTWVRWLAWPWELFVISATWFAGKLLNLRLQGISRGAKAELPG